MPKRGQPRLDPDDPVVDGTGRTPKVSFSAPPSEQKEWKLAAARDGFDSFAAWARAALNERAHGAERATAELRSALADKVFENNVALDREAKLRTELERIRDLATAALADE